MASASSAAPNRVQGELFSTRCCGSCGSRSDLRLTWPAFYTAGVTFGLCLISPLGASAGGRHSRTMPRHTGSPIQSSRIPHTNPAKMLSPHPPPNIWSLLEDFRMARLKIKNTPLLSSVGIATIAPAAQGWPISVMVTILRKGFLSQSQWAVMASAV